MSAAQGQQAAPQPATGAEDAEWVRRVGALTVEREGARTAADPADQLGTAEEVAQRLASLARALDATHDADRGDGPCTCRQTPCQLAVGPNPHTLRALATALASAAPHAPAAAERGPALVSAYLQVLRVAAPAVYLCRRVQHASGRCWFSQRGPDDGLCGQVLWAGHALRGGASTIGP